MRRLFVLLAAAVLVLAFAVPTLGRGTAVQVAAQVGWTPALFGVVGPTTIHLDAAGSVHGATGPGNGPAGAGGLTCGEAADPAWYTEAEYGPCFAWDAYFGELVWRVGGNPGVGLDGASEIYIPAGVSGILYLAVNDFAYTLHDNGGQFTVTLR